MQTMLSLSETAEGLQNCLNNLQAYCELWGLKVNIKKNKSMIFNNTGRLENVCFRYENKVVEILENIHILVLCLVIQVVLLKQKRNFIKRASRLTLNFASVLSIINLK